MHLQLGEIRDLFRSRTEIYEDAYQGRQFDAIYFAMLVFACLIALLGLLLNSPAVIIGAMLISPLMGPILSCGLALTIADWALGKKAARNVALSILETILIAVLATLVSPLKDATPEILARTNPNLMDLLIAFFSGAAGTLALCSRKGALTILPGVAIATAVMPPLATAGYGISTGQWEIAGGAFMLFFTNLTAIIISADLVFLVVGFRPERSQATRELTRFVRSRFVIAAGVLIFLSIPLIRTLTRAAQQANFQKEVLAVLAEQLSHSAERKLGVVSLQLRGNELSVEAAVQTTKFIEPEDIHKWEVAIQSRVRRPVRLELQQLQLARKDMVEQAPATYNKDFLAGGAIKPLAPAEQHPTVASELDDIQSRVQTALSPFLPTLGVQDFKLRSVASRPDTSIAMELAGNVPRPVHPESWQVLAAAVSRELHSPIELTGSLAVGEPVLLRFHARSLRLRASNRRLLGEFLLRWESQPEITYQLALSDSSDQALTERRISLLKKRSTRISVGEENDQAADADTIILRALQHLNASAQEAPTPKTPDAPASKAE
jgi:uncharacterized hydrophobic protein (TIGR00271 family)